MGPSKRDKSALAPALDQQQVRQMELESALERIRALESEIAGAIRRMQEKVTQMEYLMEFSSLMNSTLDPEIVREKALQATCQLLACETASLLLVDKATGELFWETALGTVGKELKKMVRLPINDRSIAGYVAMTGEGLILNDVESDPRHYKKATQGSTFRPRTMLCVPLKNKDRTVGVLQAINKVSTTSAKGQKSKYQWPVFHLDDFKLLESLAHQVAIAIENSTLYITLKQSFYGTVEALAEAIEKKDQYTGGHTKRVVHYSMCIAKHMNLTSEQVERIRLGALLHDIGKIGIDDKILKKQATLDSEEWQEMQKHPEVGFDIMKRVEGLRDVIGGMRYHHERWDGKGYPLHLKGEEIPLVARIIAVADTFDAMVSTRPYRKGMDPKLVFEEIIRCRGAQFDPVVVDAFVQAFHQENMGL
jgi:HD-GYP domain-containing protein (c-di-GMP phosphodiesterase class II)